MNLLPLLVTLFAAAPPASPSAVPPRSLVGVVMAVERIDAATGRITVAESIRTGTPRKAGTPAATPVPIVLSIDAKTHLVRGKLPASFADLKAKDHVVIRYSETASGLVATSVRVADPATPTPRPPAGAATTVPAGAAGPNAP